MAAAPVAATSAAPALPAAGAAGAGQTPLDYLLSVMRDEDADPRIRMQAASIAAAFVHQKPGEAAVGGGKKVQIEQAARKAVVRFASRAPALKVVSGG